MTSLLQLPNDFYIQRSRGVRYQLEKNFLNKIVQHNFKQTFPALKRLIRSKEYKNNPSVFGSKLHEEKRALTNKIMSIYMSTWFCLVPLFFLLHTTKNNEVRQNKKVVVRQSRFWCITCRIK